MERGLVKLVRFNGHSTLTIPAKMAAALPEECYFRPELTDEGILYRPVYVKARKGFLPGWIAGVGQPPAGAGDEVA